MVKKHWMSGTRFYRIYHHIWNRCNREKNDNYNRYWWKWIKILWNCFEEFKNDMYDSYIELSNKIWEKYVSIERLDNNKSYSKENCKWIHINEQQKNRRCNHYITYKWKTHNLREWAKILWLGEVVLRNRIVVRKWSIEKAFTTKTLNTFWNPNPIRIVYKWKKYTVKEFEVVSEFSRRSIYRMIKRWELETIT